MKLKTILKVFFILTIITGISSCKKKIENQSDVIENKKEIRVFNFDNKQQLSDYNKLNLDQTHPNLLNPQIARSDYNSVRKSWTDLHQSIAEYLAKNEFNWGVEDTSIVIVQKIYFNANGEIKDYFFNVLNENVTKEKKEQFANLITAFAKSNKIELNRDKQFAQCGKTKYMSI